MNLFKCIFTGYIPVLLFFVSPLFAQESQINSQVYPPRIHQHAPLSFSDSLALVNLPVLIADENLLKTTLPFQLDNSTQPYFRPLFEQVASECGQAAAIAYTFTYEINYSRNSAANIPQHQYPTHYTYNFHNGGYGWHGVSYYHSFEIVKTNGHPSLEEFGSMNECGPSFWMSGYDKYYNGMYNKIDEVYQLPVGTEDGLLVLKNWLHNHLTGDEVGGIACFYSATPWNTTTLPEGTPEAGKHVMTEYYIPATHSSTIVGYNDSIRYDYNQDGQYTNHIDINGDGEINMQDWEIGGLKFSDSYLGGVNWADSGFCYMMYKTLADRDGEGGIWNHLVHVVKPKEDYSPLLTLKAEISYNCRKNLKVVAGVSEDPAAAFPEHNLGFPIFDYQGGCQHMKGGWEPEALSLEFGLDITPLLGWTNSGSEAKFFLQVFENDPDNMYSGSIVHYSIIDHTNGDVEYSYPQTDMPITQNSPITLGIPAEITFNELVIQDGNLPLAHTEELYEHQLLANGGTPPYTWNLLHNFEEITTPADFPVITDVQLIPEDTIHSQALQPIEFQFPFYGNAYDSIWVHTDGFLMFDEQIYPWPYLYDEHLMIQKTKNIAPFLNWWLRIDEAQGDGIWYEGDAEQAYFRWKVTALRPDTMQVEFAVKLSHTGEIEFYYNTDTIFYRDLWAAGTGNGDDINYQFTQLSNTKDIINNEVTKLIPGIFPFEFSISDEGILSGTPILNYNGIDLTFEVSDYNELSHRKTLPFYSFYAGNDELIIDGSSKLNIIPNPTSNEFVVDFHLEQRTSLEIILLDLNGHQYLMESYQDYLPGKHQKEFHFSGPSGVYHLLLISEGKVHTAKKIVFIKN